MSPADRDRVKYLLAQAARMPASLRRAFIEQSAEAQPEIAAEVLNLLPTLEDSAFMSAPTGAGMTASIDSAMAGIEVPGARIGRYKLLQRLGEGGFGIVFMAEQTEPVIRRVALKIIKAGMDTRQVIARFEAERQALALMDHPNIAKVHDAGATESGRPYFVMELVRGDSVTEYCDREKLSIEQRVQLFQSICGAVHHAHQKGIIHRDLKPSNVLVTVADGRPLPKVIDFGIAKATAVKLTDKTLFTEMHQLIGTPEYMSPEQAESSGVDIDTRSDVYALGVLLYELLVGGPPFEGRRLRSAPFAEMQRIIQNEEPPRPSLRYRTLAASSSAINTLPSDTLNRRAADSSAMGIAMRRRTEPPILVRSLRGDLDWIVMKCLEKDRGRRYGTASELADDIGRYIRHEAVLATPPSGSYRLRKFVRRHRGAVTATAVVAATLVIATGISIRYAMQASRALAAEQKQRALVEQRERETQEVAQFQAVMLSDIDIVTMGDGLKSMFRDQVRAGLERAKDDISSLPSNFSEESTDGRLAVYDHIVGPVEPVDVARRVLDEFVLGKYAETAAKKFSQQPRVESELLHTMGSVSLALGLYDRAEIALRRAVELRRDGSETDEMKLAKSLSQLAGLLSATGRREEAEKLHRETLDIVRRQLGDEHGMTISSMNNIAVMRAARGDITGAEAMLREALGPARRLHGDDRKTLATTLSSLGELLQSKGDHAAAEAPIREALELRRELFGDLNDQVADSLSSLGGVYYHRGDMAEAEELLRESLGIKRKLLGEDHVAVADGLGNLAAILDDQGDRDGARAIYRETLAMYHRLPGNHGAAIGRTLSNLGMLLMRADELVESESLFREALDYRRKSLGPEHPEVILNLCNLGVVLRRQNQMPASEEVYREAVEIASRRLMPNHPWRMNSQLGLARTLLALEKFEEAERQLLAIEEKGDSTRLTAPIRDMYMKSYVELYEALEKKFPNKGHEQTAAKWRDRRMAWQPTTRPSPP